MELKTSSLLVVLCGFECRGVREGLPREYMPGPMIWDVCPDARSSAMERDSISRLPHGRRVTGVGG